MKLVAAAAPPAAAEVIAGQLYPSYRRSNHYEPNHDRLEVPHLTGGQQPTLPPELVTDALIYVAAVFIFYVAIIVIIVGSNLHRFKRNRNNVEYVELAATSAAQEPQGAVTHPADDAISWVDESLLATV